MRPLIDTILIDALTPECRIAWLGQSGLADLKIFRPGQGPRSGDVVLGRVKAVQPSIRGAFVEIGDGRDGFLPFPGKSDRAPVTEGAAVIVQVRHEAMAEKGARLTTRISLGGRFAVYTPDQPGVNISRKSADSGLADQAAEKAVGIIEPGDGAIIRTAALQAGEAGVEQTVRELTELRDAWLDARALSAQVDPPHNLIDASDPVTQALQDVNWEQVGRIAVEGADAFGRAKSYLAKTAPAFADRLESYKGSEGLFAEEGVEAAIGAALKPRVDLPSGGCLYIHETPACITVDVDTSSAGAKSGRKGRALIRETNGEAALALARELRLRNLSGNIVVDFIRDGDRDAGRALLETLRAACADDPVPVTVEGFTRLEMVEIQRRRRGRSLPDILSGRNSINRGADKSAETLAYDVLRRLLHVSQARPGRALTVEAAPAVIGLLNNPLKAALDDIKVRAGVSVTLTPDETMPVGVIDVYS